MECNIEATDVTGGTLEKLAELTALREKYLKGETTENAVTATAINILSSLRAATKVADPKKASEFGYQVYPALGVAGFKSPKGSNKGHRVVRVEGGHELSGSKVINLAGGYVRGEQVRAFTVLIKSPKINEKLRGGYERVYIIAHNQGEVEKWAKKRIENYIKVYGGMAKWALGQAQSQVYQAANGGDSVSCAAAAKRTALENLIVEATGNGWNSGSFSIYVGDRLQYASLALRGGPSDVNLALQKAANRTAAIINKLGSAYRMDEQIPTPFPEITKKGSK